MLDAVRAVQWGVAFVTAYAGFTGAAAARAAEYTETFDDLGPVESGQWGPPELIAAGWIFRNQSAPLGSGTWFDGYPDYFPPFAGSGYLAVDSLSTDYFGGDISTWAILPPIPDQQAGDTISFRVRRMESSNFDTLQLRYSPTGGTGTGSGPDAVGDFTEVLADLSPIPLTGWTLVSATVPGPGRLALRYYVDDACTWACFSSYVGVDELVVSAAPPAGPPLPAAGQTVHWTSVISPVVIDVDTTIVATATLIVDPGVDVLVQDGATLYVVGAMRWEAGSALHVTSDSNVHVTALAEFLGAADTPVTLTGGLGGIFASGVEVAPGGAAHLDYVVSDLPVYVHHEVAVYGDNTTTITIDHSTFTGDGDVRSRRGTLAIRNSTFDGPTVEIQESYLLFDAVTLDGSTLLTERRKAGQPVHIDDVVAHNVTTDAPFQLAGFDHYFGPDNTIQNNLYPVHLLGGGVAPGSTLPATGNINNYVHGGVGTALGQITFADTGLFYRIDLDPAFPALDGQLTIEPGVHVKFSPGAELFLYVSGRLIADGLPDNPIVFEPLEPAAPWWGLAFDLVPSRPRLEHCILQGAEGGAIVSRCTLRLESVLLQDNIRAGRVGGFGLFSARKCRVLNNDTGVQTSTGAPPGFGSGTADLTGTTNPNSFAGNGVALEVQDPLTLKGIAPDNWWNHPTGPQHPTNPGGQGELVTGLADVLPFRTTPPDFTDHPPLVRLVEPYFLMQEGNTVVLNWSASDDSAIVTQRILFSPHSENPPLEVLIDDIPPGQTALELTVPQAPPSSNIEPSVFRVVAVDDAGQEGWAEAIVFIPYLDFTERVIPDPIVGAFRPGEVVDVCWQFTGGMGGTVDAVLFLDGDGQSFSLGGAHTGVDCLSLGLVVPPVSTDLARVGLRFNYGAGGRNRWEFTDYFTIRPDPSLADAPPDVSLLGPAAGAEFPGGGTVPITWTASDDEALRSFDIQATYDDGLTWHTIVSGLPGSATSYNWGLPPSKGIPAVRVRVIARDLRFQNSSATSGVFAISAGSGFTAGDLNCDGAVNAFDIDPFILALTDPTAYAATWPACDVQLADINGDGTVNAFDIDPFVALLTGASKD